MIRAATGLPAKVSIGLSPQRVVSNTGRGKNKIKKENAEGGGVITMRRNTVVVGYRWTTVEVMCAVHCASLCIAVHR